MGFCLLCLIAALACSFHPTAAAAAAAASISMLNGKDVKIQAPQRSSHSHDAYVTLLYGDYDIGARVLGQSLVESGTVMDRVALCTEAVSAGTKEVLEAEGWIIRSVPTIPNPHADGSSLEMSSVYSKLYAWSMTEYRRIVFLDADTLVLSNVDHLFDCGTFCAAVRHSDFFNSGVMVLEPSAIIFKDMMKKAPMLPSYDGGDQGFLNEYFKDLIYAPFFNVSVTRRQHQISRMPSGFNADVAQYYCLSKWLFAQDEMWIIHLSFGSLRPWVWWESRVFDQNWRWTAVRKRLPYHNHADNPASYFLYATFWAPYPIALLLGFILKHYCHWVNSFDNDKIACFATFNQRFSHFVPLPAILLSYYLAFFYIVPTTMLPSQAEYVFWLWSSLFLWFFMGTYCCLCHVASKLQDPPSQSISRKLLYGLILFVVFTLSHVIQTLAPLAIAAFGTRMRTFVALSVVHLMIGQAIGQAVIQLWTKSCVVHCNRDKKAVNI